MYVGLIGEFFLLILFGSILKRFGYFLWEIKMLRENVFYYKVFVVKSLKMNFFFVFFIKCLLNLWKEGKYFFINLRSKNGWNLKVIVCKYKEFVDMLENLNFFLLFEKDFLVNCF